MDSDLTKFRAEKGISLHEISTKLNIPEKFLLAIEDLSFDELPAPIFAKSQIKKYYSFFDLEPLIILEKYENFLKEKNISNQNENQESSQSFFSNFLPNLLEKRITLLSIIIFSLIILSYLIFGSDDQKRDISSIETSSEDQEILDYELVTNIIIKEDGNDITDILEDQIAFDQDPDVPTIDIGLEEYDKNILSDDNVTEIEIIVQGESWVEIIDDEQILLFELLQTGLYEVTGYGPFKFKIGHSPSVKIYLNGKNIDFSETVSRYTDYAHFSYENGVVVELFKD
ncbi:MAG: helix-turn-helix domain-containing protein [Gammaproteobacteria bacterium]